MTEPCQHRRTKVINSRRQKDGRVIYRRRRCVGCGFRFSTYEHFPLGAQPPAPAHEPLRHDS